MGRSLLQRIRAPSPKTGGDRKSPSVQSSQGGIGRRRSKSSHKPPPSPVARSSGSYSQLAADEGGSRFDPFENGSIAVQSLTTPSKDDMSSLQFGESATNPAQLRLEQLGGGQGRVVTTPGGSRKAAAAIGSPNCVGSLELDDALGRRMENLHTRRLQPPPPVDSDSDGEDDDGEDENEVGGVGDSGKDDGGGLSQVGSPEEASRASRHSVGNASRSSAQSRRSAASRRSSGSRQSAVSGRSTQGSASVGTAATRASVNRSGGPVDLDDSDLSTGDATSLSPARSRRSAGSEWNLASRRSASGTVRAGARSSLNRSGGPIDLDDSVLSSDMSMDLEEKYSSEWRCASASPVFAEREECVFGRTLLEEDFGDTTEAEGTSEGDSERLLGAGAYAEDSVNIEASMTSMTSSEVELVVSKFENSVSDAEKAILKSLSGEARGVEADEDRGEEGKEVSGSSPLLPTSASGNISPKDDASALSEVEAASSKVSRRPSRVKGTLFRSLQSAPDSPTSPKSAPVWSVNNRHKRNSSGMTSHSGATAKAENLSPKSTKSAKSLKSSNSSSKKEVNKKANDLPLTRSRSGPAGLVGLVSRNSFLSRRKGFSAVGSDCSGSSSSSASSLDQAAVQSMMTASVPSSSSSSSIPPPPPDLSPREDGEDFASPETVQTKNTSASASSSSSSKPKSKSGVAAKDLTATGLRLKPPKEGRQRSYSSLSGKVTISTTRSDKTTPSNNTRRVGGRNIPPRAGGSHEDAVEDLLSREAKTPASGASAFSQDVSSLSELTEDHLVSVSASSPAPNHADADEASATVRDYDLPPSVGCIVLAVPPPPYSFGKEDPVGLRSTTARQRLEETVLCAYPEMMESAEAEEAAMAAKAVGESMNGTVEDNNGGGEEEEEPNESAENNDKEGDGIEDANGRDEDAAEEKEEGEENDSNGNSGGFGDSASSSEKMIDALAKESSESEAKKSLPSLLERAASDRSQASTASSSGSSSSDSLWEINSAAQDHVRLGRYRHAVECYRLILRSEGEGDELLTADGTVAAEDRSKTNDPTSVTLGCPDPPPPLPYRRPLLSSTHHNLTVLYVRLGLYGDALRHCQRALKLRRDTLSVSSNSETSSVGGDSSFRLDVASSLSELGLCHYARNEFGRALGAMREGLQILCSVLGYDHPRVATALNNVGCVHFEMGRWVAAAATFDEALDIRRGCMGSAVGSGCVAGPADGSLSAVPEDDDSSPPAVAASAGGESAEDGVLDSGAALCNAAVVAAKRGELETSIELMDEGLMVQQSVLGDEHRRSKGTEAMLMGLVRLLEGEDEAYEKAKLIAKLDVDESKPEEAAIERKRRTTFSIPFGVHERTKPRDIFGSSDGIPNRRHSNHSGRLQCQGCGSTAYDGIAPLTLGPLCKEWTAEQRVREALSAHLHFSPDDNGAADEDDLRRIKSMGSYQSTQQSAGKSMSIPVDADGDGGLADAELHLRRIHESAAESLAEGQHDEALELFRGALVSHTEKYGETHHLVGSARHNMGVVYLHAGNYGAALEEFREAARVRRTSLGPDHPDSTLSLSRMGYALLATCDPDGALTAFQRVLASRRKSLGYSHPAVAATLRDAAAAHYECGGVGAAAAAARALDEALEILRRKGPNSGEDSDDFNSGRRAVVALVLADLGFLQVKRGECAEAMVQLEESIKIRREDCSSNCCCSMAAANPKEMALRNLAYAMASANQNESNNACGDDEELVMKIDMYMDMLCDGDKQE